MKASKHVIIDAIIKEIEQGTTRAKVIAKYCKKLQKSSTLFPKYFIAYLIKKILESFGVINFYITLSSVYSLSGLSAPNPNLPVSSPLSAFWKDSLNVLPIAITSPTDFVS